MNKIFRPLGRDFINEKGEVVRLHGINMVCKDSSLNHIGDYKEEDFKFLSEQGFNVIRFGIYWESAEPSPGEYDDAYLSKIEEMINQAGKYGLSVFLDMHQDLYGSIFEDGAPEWATLTDGKEHIRTDLWSDSYLLSPAVQTAFDNFWANTKASDGIGLLDHYANMWLHIAKRFKDNPFVIGYDFLNEPFPGTAALPILEIVGDIKEKVLTGTATEEDLFATIAAIEPITGKFEEEVLIPFYEKIGRLVRTVDKEICIMLENNYFSNAGVPTHVRPGKYADGTVIENQVFSPHGYDIFVDTDDYDTGDNSRVDLIFMTHKAMCDQMNIPMIVGEWGCYPDATPSQVEQANHLKELFEMINAGDTYFDFSHIYGNPVLEALKSV